MTTTPPPLTTQTDSSVRWAPRTTELTLVSPSGGDVALRLGDRGRTRPFLLLHGGAGPATVAGFGDLLATREHERVLVPTHPGFDGTSRPDDVTSVPDLARLYVALLDRLDLWDVTVIGNSVGGWIAAEIALLRSPRVSGAVLVDAVGADVPGEPVADIRGMAPAELRKRSFHDPDRFAPNPTAGGPTTEMVAANMATLFTYGGVAMTDPTLLERLHHLDLPVRVIWGESDRIVSIANGRALAASIPGAEFIALPRAGHLPQLEAPEELLAAILGERS